MRAFLCVTLIGFALLLLGVTGCNDDNNNRSTITATVQDQISGSNQSGAFVALSQNGVATGTTDTTNTNGVATLTSVRNGTGYFLEATNSFARTIVGPIRINGADRSITIQTLTAAEIETTYDLSAPGAGAATLLVFGQSNFNNATFIPVTVAVDTGATSTAGNPVIVQGVSLTTHDITVTDPATEQSVVVPDVIFDASEFVVLRVVFTDVTTLTLEGQVRGAQTLAGQSANIAVFRNGNAVTTGTANSNGQYTISGLSPAAGVTLDVTSGTDAFVHTLVGPSTFTGNQTSNNIDVYTAAELNTLFGVTAPPNNTTTTLVVLAKDLSGNILSVVVNNNQGTTLGPGAPVVAGVPAGTYNITVTNTANDEAVTLRNVVLTGGTIEVIEIPAGTISD